MIHDAASETTLTRTEQETSTRARDDEMTAESGTNTRQPSGWAHLHRRRRAARGQRPRRNVP
jgi:hypothetical protein